MINNFIKKIIPIAAIFPILLALVLSLFFVFIPKNCTYEEVEHLVLMMGTKAIRFTYIAVTGYLLSYYLKDLYTKIVFLSTGIFYTLLTGRMLFYLVFKIHEYTGKMNDLFWFGNIALLIIFTSTLLIIGINGGTNFKASLGRNKYNSID